MTYITFQSPPAHGHKSKDDEWTEFDIKHKGGIHSLQMLYAAKYSSPCVIRINGKEENVSVGGGITGDDSLARWFLDEGRFDLGPALNSARVGFRARDRWPAISSFQFVPESEVIPPRGKRPINVEGKGYDNNGKMTADSSMRWRKCPTAITFYFEIGLCMRGLDESDVEFTCAYLRGKSVKFIYGEAHDAVVIDGALIGTRLSGDNFPEVTFLARNSNILTATLGLSSWSGEGAFNSLRVTKTNGSGCGMPAAEKVVVGARLIGPTWTYDRNRLGLNLWLTSIYPLNDRPVARYGFVLSSDDKLSFNPLEFENFWAWLVRVKHKMLSDSGSNQQRDTNRYERERIKPIDIGADSRLNHSNTSPDSGTRLSRNKFQKEVMTAKQRSLKPPVTESSATIPDPGGVREILILEEKAVKKKMEPLYNYILASFSLSPANPSSFEGYLYGTSRHTVVTFDVFSICIHFLPGGEVFQSTLFVDGIQYDTQSFLLEQMKLKRNDILAFAISESLRDTGLLLQMGLVLPVSDQYCGDDASGGEHELLPLREDAPLFQGDYANTVMARRVINILVIAGLRKVSYNNIAATVDGWDIYSIASGANVVLGKYQRNAMYLAAIVCALIQLITPTFLIYRAILSEAESLTWDVYAVRFLFGLYAIFYEYKTWDIDNVERVVGWLCFLPEFDTRKVILGMAINKLSKVVVSVAIVTLMWRSFSITDVTLNALALYFIVDVDNNLVNARVLETIRSYQQKEYLNIKSKTAVEYYLPGFEEKKMPKVKDLPARYFQIASHWNTDFCILILSIGCIWMLVEPFVFGWEL